MALTLLEAAKQMKGEDKRAAIIEIFATQTDILRAFPFVDIQGNALRYTLEQTLPGIAFRGVNEGYTESTGVINPQTEYLTIAGGDLDVDNFILRTMGEDQRSTHESMKLKALAHNWSNKVIKGDSSTSPKEFDGLQKRLTGNQKIAAGSTDGGTALSLAKLDEAIDAVDMPTHLLMSKAMRRLLNVAARTTTIGGFINYAVDKFGNKIERYNDLEILIADKNADLYATLAFDEASNHANATATATSIYVLSLGENMLAGIQNGTPIVDDLGQLHTKPAKRTRMEWYAGLGLFHPRAASRLWSIANSPVTA